MEWIQSGYDTTGCSSPTQPCPETHRHGFEASANQGCLQSDLKSAVPARIGVPITAAFSWTRILSFDAPCTFKPTSVQSRD